MHAVPQAAEVWSTRFPHHGDTCGNRGAGSGAVVAYLRPNGYGVSALSGKLPCGTLPRLVLPGLYAELLRTGEHSVALEYYVHRLVALSLLTGFPRELLMKDEVQAAS